MRIVREGTNTVGLHFVTYRARYLARGWVRSIAILPGGPTNLSMYFGKTLAATTTNGIFTRANFTPAALAIMDAHPIPLPDKDLLNLCAVKDIHLDASEPTDRQNYFVLQTWVQLFDQRHGTDGTMDMHYDPVPCIHAFNLISGDPTAKILSTTPLDTAA